MTAGKLGEALKRQRLLLAMRLRELSSLSGISSSHLGRIERGERFPSAPVLRRIAGPLGFNESELFALAGYLSAPNAGIGEKRADYAANTLDPYVSHYLSQEPPEIQRAVIGIISLLKNITLSLK